MPAWPKALAEENGVQLVVGQVAGIAVDERNGNVWIIHRPATLLDDEEGAQENPPDHRCCKSRAAGAEVRSRRQLLASWGAEAAATHGSRTSTASTSTATATSGSAATTTATRS